MLPVVRVVCATLLTCLPASWALADTLLLADGGFLQGVSVTETEKAYEIAFAHGRIALAKKDVEAHYAAEDPRGEAAVREIEEHAKWRNRRKVETACFRYESTLPGPVFARYRSAMDGHLRLVEKALGLVAVEAKPPLVCLHASQRKFRQISGTSTGSGYYKRREPLELALFDDRTTRVVNLGVARWTVAAYAVHRRWPALPHDFFLTQGLDSYCAGLVPDSASPRGYRVLVPGDRWFAVFWSRQKRLPVDLGRLFERRASVSQGWRWALVHFLMESEAYAPLFRSYLDEVRAKSDTEAYHALLDALDLNGLEERGTFLSDWEAHLDTLEITTAAAFIRAAEVADYYRAREEAGRLYMRALEFPEARRAARSGLSDLARYRDAGARMVEEQALLAEDPIDADARCRLARCLRKGGDEEGAEREAALAAEIAAARGIETPDSCLTRIR